MHCYCGSLKPFSECCEPLLAGKERAMTAEALMRSRYTAFAVADMAYVERTTDPVRRSDFDRVESEKWAKESEWRGLEILATTAGSETDTLGSVEFIATYKSKGFIQQHHESAQFRKIDSEWFFVDGKTLQEPHRATSKVGRNDPCPCGSQKKYKKCCGAQ
jgi:SEC-C motif-containing protein